MKREMARTFSGHPEPKDGWAALDGRCSFDGVDWVILYRFHEKGFLNLKIAADGRAKNKANYWFSLKLEDGSFFGRDFSVMRANRPDLCESIEKKIPEILELRH